MNVHNRFLDFNKLKIIRSLENQLSLSYLVSLPTEILIKAAIICLGNWGWGGGQGWTEDRGACNEPLHNELIPL